EHHYIVSLKRVYGGGLKDAVSQRNEVRLVNTQRIARGRVGRERADTHVGVPGKDPQHLSAYVPRRTSDSNRDRHVHNYTGFRMFCRARSTSGVNRNRREIRRLIMNASSNPIRLANRGIGPHHVPMNRIVLATVVAVA